MKKLFTKFFAVMAMAISTAVSVFGQNGFSYQAVIRDAEGVLVTNKQVEVRFSLKHDGTVYYSEKQEVRTNEYGNIQVVVGEGEKLDGDFSSVPWSTFDIKMEVSVDIDGKGEVVLGEVPVQGAPYAMHAQKAGGLTSKNANTKDGEALFSVNDASGNPVFAVFADGIVVYVDDTDTKAKRSGFVVTGRSATKGESATDYFSVTAEGTQIYVDDVAESQADKAKRSGFVVTGRSATKDGPADYLTIDGKGTTVYVEDDSSKAKRSGFVVTGRSATKDGLEPQYFAAGADGTTVYVDDTSSDKAKRSGFVVTGRTATKGGDADGYLAVDGSGTQVYVDGADAEDKARRSGFVVTGRSASKAEEDTLFAIAGGYTRVYVDEDEAGKAKRSGFVVTGRTASKDNTDLFNVSGGGSVEITTNEFAVNDGADDTQETDTSAVEPQPGDTASTPEPVVQKPKSLFTVSSGNVQVGTEMVMMGEVAKKIEADTISVDTVEAEMPVIARIVDRADTVSCAAYKPFIYGGESDSEGYALLGIYSKGTLAKVTATDTRRNTVLLIDADGNVTKRQKYATVAVLMPEGDTQIYIRPLKATSQTISFGLMRKNATEPYQYIKVEAEIEATAGVPYKIGTSSNYGGRIVIDGTVAYGDQPTFEPEPMTGYKFVRWSDGSTRAKRIFTILDDFEISAEFERMSYVVAVKSDNERFGTVTGSGSGTYWHGDTLSVKAEPATGYYFNNWSGVELDDSLQHSGSLALEVTSKLKLIAHFGVMQYTITFDSDGGSEIEPAVVYYQDKVTAPAEPQREGYRFLDWEPRLPKEMPAEDLTVKATWSVKQYLITFDTDGGTPVDIIDANYGEAVTTPEAPTREGHTFAGWSDSIPAVMPARDLRIRALWTVNQYTIKFDTDGGSKVDSITTDYGTKIAAPEIPTKEGYTFVGWDPELPATMPAELTICTAQWSLNAHNIIYVVDDTVYATIDSVNYGDEIEPIDAPERTGYTFGGWKFNGKDELPKTMPDSTVTITGGFTVNQYTIKFETDGGSKVDSITTDYGTKIAAPENPTKEGYTFTGWDPELPATMPAELTVCTAQWSLNAHNIIYVVDDTVYTTIDSVNYGDEIEPIDAPERTGYTFGGWKFNGKDELPKTMPDSDITITGGFTVNQYTIKFETDGGSKVDSITTDYGTKIAAPEIPTKEGYTFTGWDPELPATMPAELTVCTAQWSLNAHNIIYVVDDTVYATIDSVNYGDEIEPIDAPERTGYTFGGWKFNGKDGLPKTMPDSDITITGGFTVNQYTIKFETDGGSKVDSITTDYGTKIAAPENPTKEGYTFVGWDPELPATMPAELTTCTAQWSLNSHNIIYVVNDTVYQTIKDVAYGTEIEPIEVSKRTGYVFSGWQNVPATMPDSTVTISGWFTAGSVTLTFTDENGENPIVIAGNYGEKVKMPENPTKVGYTFAGWTPEVPATMPAEDATFKATWSVNQYTIRFNTDGGSKVDSITMDYGEKIAAPENPTKEGYTFAGWDPELLETMPVNGATYTAQWTVNQYTIKFETDGGTEVDSIKMNYGASVTAPENPTKEGYTFAGWKPEIPATMPAELTICTAQWSLNSHNIIYMVEDTVYATIKDVAYGTKIEPVTIASKPGYDFSGWMLNGEDEMPKTMPDSTVVLSGKWTASDKTEYTVNLFFQNADDKEYGEQPLKSFTLQGTTDAKTDYTAPDSLGFTLQAYEQVTIGGDGQTKLNIYYNRISYELTWSANGGEFENGKSDSVVTVAYGAKLVEPVSAPAMKGYTFAGWKFDGADEMPETMPAANSTFTAQWSLNYHTITYLLDGAEYKTIDSVAYGAAVTAIDDPDYPGHTFGGWKNVPATMPDEDVTITGSLTANNNTVSYKVDGLIYRVITDVEFGASIAAITDTVTEPSKTGCTFVKWNCAYTTMPDAAVTVEAEFAVNQYTIGWDANNGDALTGDYTSGEVAFDSELVEPATPTREGYAFKGWAETADATADKVVTIGKMPAYNVTYYAVWAIEQYSLTWSANGGQFDGGETEIAEKLDFGAVVITPKTEPAWTGHTFTGWSDTLATMPSKAMTILAQWSLNTYNIIYMVDGKATDTTKNVAYGTTIKTSAVPTKAGYDFSGWKLNGTDNVPETMPDSSIVLAGTFSANANTPYTVNLFFQNADDKEYGEQPLKSFTLQGTTDTKTDYTAADSIGFTLQAYEQVTIGGDGQTKLNIYYNRNSYELTWKADGGQFADGKADSVATVAYGAAVVAPKKNPTMTGYTFAGWDTVPAVMPATAMTITAQWTINKYAFSFSSANTDLGTVTATANGKTIASGDNVDYGTEVTLSAKPAEHYHFRSWSDAYSYSQRTVTVTAAVSYEAQFAPDNYTVSFVSNNGENDTLEMSVAYGTATQLNQNIFEKTGYKFAGWAVKANGNVVFADKANLFVEGQDSTWITTDTILYAKWASIDVDYKVEHWQEGLDGKYVRIDSVTVNTKGKTDSQTTAEALTFTGFTAPATIAQQTIAADGSTVVAIYYTRNSYDLTWKDGNETIGTGKLQYGAAVTMHSSLTRTGYTFVGWSDTLATMPAANTTLTAVWEINKHTVNFSAAVDGAITAKANGKTIASGSKVDYGTEVTLTATASYGGYYFFRWSDDETANTYTFTIEKDTTINAVYKKEILVGDSLVYTLTSKTEVSVGQGASKPRGELEIPATITDADGDQFSVTSFTEDAFRECTELTSVTIPDGVTKIKNCAFYGCTGLTSMDIPDGVTMICNAVFGSCTNLSSVTIPNSVKNITGSAFANCSSLTSVTIPDGVTALSQQLFENSGLTSVTIPNSVKYIYTYAFRGCVNLTSVSIPESVESIGDGAFRGCSGLTSVTLPSTCTTVESNAFYDCSNLTIYCQAANAPSNTNGAKVVKTNCKAIKIKSADETLGTAAFATVGGIAADGSTWFAAGDEIELQATPKSEMYELDKYTVDGAEVTSPYTVTADATITAVFKMKSFTVNFNLNGGTGTFESQTVVYGSTMVDPNDVPSREGYTFDGWYGDEDYNHSFDFAGAIIRDTTIYAKWKQNYAKVGGTLYFDLESTIDAISEVSEEVTIELYSAVTAGDLGNIDEPNTIIYTIAYIQSQIGVTLVVPEGANIELEGDCSGLFQGMMRLVSADLRGLNTVGVTDMNSMFFNCKKLESLDVSGFNTEKVTDMNQMFYGCEALTTLDVSGFNTGDVTDMNSMFYGCSALTTFDLSGFNTEKVTDMNHMFYDCSALTTIYAASGADWSGVYSSDDMFTGCENLKGGNNTEYISDNVNATYARIDKSGQEGYFTDINSVYGSVNGVYYNDPTDLYNAIDTATGNAKVVLTGKVTASDLGGSGPKKIISAIKSSSASSISLVIPATAGIELEGDCSGLFNSCSKLVSADLRGLKTANVTNMSMMFRNCANLKTLDLSSFNTASVSNMGGMFYGCANLQMLDLSGFNTDKVTDMSSMFLQCPALTTINVAPGADWSGVGSSENMFKYCTKLVGGSGTTFDENNIDATRARIDGGESAPGYFTCKLLSYYVNPATGNDSNTGLSAESALHSLAAALGKMNDRTTNYNIFVSGKLTGAQGLGDTLNTRARSISLVGARGWNDSVPQDTLDGGTRGITLTIGTTVPVTVNNIVIYGGLNNVRYSQNPDANPGGGVYLTANGKLTLTNSIVAKNKTRTLQGAGIYLSKGSALTMENSVIKDNWTSENGKTSTNYEASKSCGGGVYVSRGATFNMLSGTITENNTPDGGGGVFVCGTFNMYGGTISTNIVTHSNVQYVADVEVAPPGTFNMYGGTITQDESSTLTAWNGAVCLFAADYDSGTAAFNMHGGSITKMNDAKTNGTTSGVYLSGKTNAPCVFNMYGGEITDNKSIKGGALYLENNSTATLKGGLISGNTATSSGNGVYVNSANSKLILSDSIKFGANDDIYLYNSSEVLLLNTLTAEAPVATISVPSGKYSTSTQVLDLADGATTTIGDECGKFAMANTSWCVKSNGYLGDVYARVGGITCADLASTVTAIQNATGTVDVVLTSKVTASDLGKAATSGTIINAIKTNEHEDARFNLVVPEGANIALEGEDCKEMFNGCSKLVSADLRGFNTGNVTNMGSMFNYCSALTTLDLSGFNTENVTNMSNMFGGCFSLTTIYTASGANWYKEGVTSTDMFKNCLHLVGGSCTTYDSHFIDATRARVDGVDGQPGYFTRVRMPGELYAKVNDTLYNDLASTIAAINRLKFKYDVDAINLVLYSGVTATDLGKAATSGTIIHAIANSQKNVNLEVSEDANIILGSDCQKMFYQCQKLVSANLRGFNTENVTDMSFMFNFCGALTTLDVSGFNTANVSNMRGMFFGCGNLNTLDLSGFNTQNVTDMNAMFMGCSALITLDLSGFNTQNVTEMNTMFTSCSALTTIYVAPGVNWYKEEVLTSTEMFMNCTKLVGGSGTTFDENNIDATRARIDGGESAPGYFTCKQQSYYVNPATGNDSNTGLSAESALQSLAAALGKMNDRATYYNIFVSGKLTGAQGLGDTLNTRAKSITLTGLNGWSEGVPQDTLDGGFTTNTENGRPLTISTTVPVTVRYLALIGGYNSTNGGGLYAAENSQVTLDSSYVAGNKTKVQGAGIYLAEGSVVTMSSTVISENEIFSKVNGTETTKTCGGGVYIGRNATFNMKSGSIVRNITTDGGGGVFARGTFNMLDGTISTNYFKYSGTYVTNIDVSPPGTVNMYGGTITIDDNNTYGIKDGVVIVYAGSSDEGAATFNMHGGSITNTNSTSNDVSTSVNKSVVLVLNDNNSATNGCSCDFNMTGGEITGNQRRAVYVGAKYAGTANATATLTGGTISGNVDIKNGEGNGVYADAYSKLILSDSIKFGANDNIYLYNSKVLLLNTLTAEAPVATISVPSSDYSTSTQVLDLADGATTTIGAESGKFAVAPQDGSTLWAISDEGYLTQTINSASSLQSAVNSLNASGISATITLSNNITLTRGFSGKDADHKVTIDGKNHYHIEIQNDTTDIVFKNVDFQNGYASGTGGMLNLMGKDLSDDGEMEPAENLPSLTIENCSFANCKTGGSWGEDGGAIWVKGYGNVAVKNTTFQGSGSYQAMSGGFIAAFLHKTQGLEMTIEGCSFTGGTASFGGALNIHTSDDAVVTINNCTFTGNEAESGGTAGAIDFFSSATLNISSTTFSDNEGQLVEDGMYTPNNVYLRDNSQAILTNCTVGSEVVSETKTKAF